MRILTSASKHREKGNSIIEFAIIAPFLVTALLGVVGIGLTLGRSTQVNQVTRDTAHMFFDGVDFSQASNQKIVGRLAYGMGLASDAVGTINTSGNGDVILTEIILVGATECANGGYATTASCPNYNKLVIEKRVVIGNSSLRTSSFGTPTPALIAGDGSITPVNFCTDASTVVTSGSVASSLNLSAGQYSFIVESYFISPELAGFIGNQAYAYVMM
jgi:hypothetical protein